VTIPQFTACTVLITSPTACDFAQLLGVHVEGSDMAAILISAHASGSVGLHTLTGYAINLGQHSENPPDVLQVQGMPKAHPAQSHPVQGRKGTIQGHKNTQNTQPRTGQRLTNLGFVTIRLPSSRRVSAVTIASRAVTVVRPSRSSGKRPRPQRRSCYVWSAQSARPRHSLR
jgi:hypothetical protein